MSSELRLLGGKIVFLQHHAPKDQIHVHRVVSDLLDEVETTKTSRRSVLGATQQSRSSVQWFPLMPVKRECPAVAEFRRGGGAIENTEGEGSGSPTFSIELLPPGTFANDDLGTAGGHGTVDHSSLLVWPHLFNSKRQTWKEGESEADFLVLIPELVASVRDYLLQHPNTSEYSAEQLVGCIMEFMLSSSAHGTIHDLTRLRSVVQGPGGWIGWAEDTLNERDDDDD
jgi:hypothetical protein